MHYAASVVSVPLIGAEEGVNPPEFHNDFQTDGLISLADASLYNRASILGDALSQRDGLLRYKAQSGDTLSGIAARFNITLNTILWANPKLSANRLSIGTEVVIPPVSGVLYTAIAGDTEQSIAAFFGIDANELKKTNKLSPGDVKEGAVFVIPGGKPKKSVVSLASAPKLPDLRGYFTYPAPDNSWNWGVLHNDNAVDIANVCGTPVSASADGLVAKIGFPDSWSGGYGGYVEIEHPNGTQTLYAHLESVLVDVGAFVSRGDDIGKIGRTGNVHGPTGCHVHFEVYGAKNPFAK